MNKKPNAQQQAGSVPKYKQLFYRNRRSTTTPPSLLIMGDNVRMFYNVMEKLRLMNPKTGLNARRYGLVILHDYPFVYLDKEKSEMVTKTGTLYASIVRESFEKYFQIDEKNRDNEKLNVPLMAFHHAFFVANEELPLAANQPMSTRSNIMAIRSIHGQKHLQFVQFSFMGTTHVADKILSTIFKLDFMTDSQAESITKDTIDKAKGTPSTEKQD